MNSIKFISLLFLVLLFGGCTDQSEPQSNFTASKRLPSPYESTKPEKGGACGLDKIVDAGDSIFLSGWAAISVKDGVLPEFVVAEFRVDEKENFVITKKEKRNDVAKYFGSEKMADSGFKVYIHKAELKTSKTILIYQLFQGKTYLCDLTASF